MNEKNEGIILGVLSKLIEQNPLTSIEKVSEDSIRFITASGKHYDVTFPVPEFSNEFSELEANDTAIEMGVRILTNRIESLVSRVVDLEGIDPHQIATELIEKQQFDDTIRGEIDSRLGDLVEGLSDSVSDSITDSISELVDTRITEMGKRLKLTERKIKKLVDQKTLTDTINETVARFNELLDEVSGVSEEEIRKIVDSSSKPVEIPNSVVSFKLKDGRMYAVFADGSEKNLGMFYDDYVMGVQGDPGPRGLSAYEIARKNGFIGTEQEWLDSLKGAGTGVDRYTFQPTGTSHTVLKTDHNFTKIVSYVARTSSGDEVSICTSEISGDFTVTANQPLDGLTVSLFGTPEEA